MISALAPLISALAFGGYLTSRRINALETRLADLEAMLNEPQS